MSYWEYRFENPMKHIYIEEQFTVLDTEHSVRNTQTEEVQEVDCGKAGSLSY